MGEYSPYESVKVTSDSDPEKSYEVKIFKNGEYACDCPFYIHKGHKDNPCKHINRVKQQIGLGG